MSDGDVAYERPLQWFREELDRVEADRDALVMRCAMLEAQVFRLSGELASLEELPSV